MKTTSVIQAKDKVCVFAASEKLIQETIDECIAPLEYVSTLDMQTVSTLDALPSDLDVAVIVVESCEAKTLELIMNRLNPSGRVLLRLLNSSVSPNELMMAFLMAGFVDTIIENDDDTDSNTTSITSIRGSKPGFEIGSSAALPSVPSKKTWRVVMDQEDEMIDEDTLLDESEPIKALTDDCETGKKRRACKDCTCGRKDMDDQPVVSTEDLKQMVSSCGNCYKGDAFRCGGCPYLGQPAFQPGTGNVVKLNLDSSDDI